MFTSIDKGKVYLEIMRQIKEGIRSGQLKKGDRLPSERQMSEQLGVSRATVREAIRSLEIMGLIHCVQGEGNFIPNNLDSSLTEPMSLIFLLNQGSVDDITELRRALELEAVALAAERITTANLERLNDLCNLLESDVDKKEKAEADNLFHYEIARASGNSLILSILNSASLLIESLIEDVRAKIFAYEGNDAAINAQHRCIVQALEEGSREKAIDSMQAHFHLINTTINKMKLEDPN